MSEEPINPLKDDPPESAVPSEAEVDEALAEAAHKAAVDLAGAGETPDAEQEGLRAKVAEYLDGWQRSRAEFANYKRRIDREQEEMRARISGELLVHYLSVMDDMERALRDRPTDGEAGAWAEGIEMIYRKLRSLLEAEGVETIAADGAAFDPNLHEAVTHEDSPQHSAGDIIAVVRQGYRIGERVLRPSQVRVAK